MIVIHLCAQMAMNLVWENFLFSKFGDLLHFIKKYLDGLITLHQSALSAGIEYRHTSVNWASNVREHFCEHVHTEYQNLVFDWDVEFGGSLFWRKIEYDGKTNRNPNLDIWDGQNRL